jgi:hypothetical protein
MTIPFLVNILCDDSFYAAISCIEICFLLLFHSTLADAQISKKNLGLPSINTVISQAPEVSSEPDPLDRTTEHVRRIADLEGRLNALKRQTTIAMGQDEKSAALSQKVSLLEEQVSILMAKVVHLEESDLYMIEIIEAVSGHLSCKLLGAP